MLSASTTQELIAHAPNPNYVLFKRIIMSHYLRLAVAILGLGLILSATNPHEILTAIEGISFWQLLPAAILMLLCELIEAIRWWVLLRNYGVELPPNYVLKSNLIARFYSQFMPGGGAVGLAIRVSSSIDEKGRITAPLAAITVERLLNLTSIFTIGSILAAITQPQIINPTLLIILFIVTTSLILLIVILRSAFVGSKLHAIPAQGMFGNLLKTMKILHDGLQDTTTLARTVILSAMSNLSALVALYLVIQTVAGAISFIDFMSAGAFIDTIQSLPITPGGLGLREGTYAFFLASLGVSNIEAVTIGLIMMLMYIIRALPGGLLLLVNSSRTIGLNCVQ